MPTLSQQVAEFPIAAECDVARRRQVVVGSLLTGRCGARVLMKTLAQVAGAGFRRLTIQQPTLINYSTGIVG